MKADLGRKTILIARRLTQSELSGNDWNSHHVPVGLVLNNGTLIYPGAAPEGLMPGEFLHVPSGKLLMPKDASVLAPDDLVGEMIVGLSPIPQPALTFLGWKSGLFLKLTSRDLYVSNFENIKLPGVFLALCDGRIGVLER